MIAKCVDSTFRALLEASGPETSIRVLRSYSMHSGMAATHNARVRFKFDGSGIKETAIPLFWLQTMMSGGDCSLDIYEAGAVLECRKCYMCIAPPEMCVAVSHGMADGIAQVVNPRYHFVFTHHLSNGDRACRSVLSMNKTVSADADLGRHLETVAPLNMTSEELNALTTHGISETLMSTVKAFVDVHGGEETVHLALPWAYKGGKELGEELSEVMQSTPVASSLPALIGFVNRALGESGSIKSAERDAIGGKVEDCPFRSAPPELCAILEEFKRGFVEAYYDSFLLSFDRMLSKGDEECIWSATGATPKKEGGDQPREDPFVILRLRLAKGEISSKEYEELVLLLGKYH